MGLEPIGVMCDPIVVYCNNKSCNRISKNIVFHDHSKAPSTLTSSTTFSDIRSKGSSGFSVGLESQIDHQVVDILTKPLEMNKLEMFRKRLL